MKLQTKVGLILAGLWIVVSIGIYAESKIILERNYVKLEDQAMLHDMRNTSKAYNIILYTLELYTLAWAQWDEAYHFMTKKDSTFIHSNFVPGTFTSSNINFFLFYDNQGKFYYGKEYDTSQNKIINLSPEILNYLSTKKDFLKQQDVKNRKIGILNTSKGLILMASLPIVTGDGKGPIKGSLLMGYYLKEEDFKRLSDLVGLKLTFFTLPLKHVDALTLQAYEQLSLSKNPYYLAPINEKITYGYTLVKDIDNHPIGLLQYELPRILYAENKLITLHYILILISLGVLVIALIWYLLKIFVLNRIISLNQQIVAINTQDDFNMRLNISGSDELQSMVGSINYMMELISNSQQKLNHMAHFDALTQLPNRIYFYKLLSAAILNAKRNDDLVCIMFIDIDNFKSINDKYGHEIGDRFLLQVAQRLQKSLPEFGVVGRQSGDEFIILLPNIKGIDAIHSAAKSIMEQTATTIEFRNISIHLSLSIGISIFPDDGHSIETLIRRADDAMYFIKKSTGNNYCFYSKITSLILK